MKTYVVRQGDYLSALALRFGFDAQQVWNASENEALRRARPNPEMLAPGDALRIPDQPPPTLAINKGTSNRYRARVPTVPITLRLEDQGHPLANEPYRVEGLPAPCEGQADADGNVKFAAPVNGREVCLVLPKRNAKIPVLIGHLDPVETSSGVRQRLQHLGLLWSGASAEGPRALAMALRALQRQQGLPVTGVLDDDTRRALVERHLS